MFKWHIILAIFSSTCQKLLKFTKIWQNSDRNNFAQFFLRHGVYRLYTKAIQLAICRTNLAGESLRIGSQSSCQDVETLLEFKRLNLNNIQMFIIYLA